MRVLHVIPSYYPAVRYGGPIRSVHGLAAALVRRGHEVHVYTTNVDGPGVSDVPTDRPVDLDGVQVHYFEVTSPRRLYRSPRLGRTVERSIATYDLLHLHSVYLWPTWVAARAAAARKVPYVLSPRGMLVGELIRRKNPWVKRAWIRLIERRSLAEAAAVHVTSALEAEELRQLEWPALAPVREVPNGLTLPTAPVARAQGPYARLPSPYALFLSRLNWKKGIDRLIDAWPRVPNLDLVVAGPDEDGYRARLEAQAAALGIARRIHFVGDVSDTHKWSLYQDAALFVLPSYSENFGNVVLEAMAMACPVVISPEVGVAPAVRAAGAGVVCPNDPAALAEAINGAMHDPQRRREMGVLGAAAVRAFYTWDAVAEEMETFYGEILLNAPRRGAPPAPRPATRASRSR